MDNQCHDLICLLQAWSVGIFFVALTVAFGIYDYLNHRK